MEGDEGQNDGCPTKGADAGHSLRHHRFFTVDSLNFSIEPFLDGF
jgi:hypothetical protein